MALSPYEALGIEVKHYEVHCFFDFYRILAFDAPDDEDAVDLLPEILSWFNVSETALGHEVHLINAETKEVIM